MLKKNAGWALIGVGLCMLFKMVRVSSFGFYRIGSASTSGITLVLLIMSAIAVVVKKNKATTGCFIASLCLLVLSLILGTGFYFAYTSLVDILLVFIPVNIGTGLVIKSTIEAHKNNK